MLRRGEKVPPQPPQDGDEESGGVSSAEIILKAVCLSTKQKLNKNKNKNKQKINHNNNSERPSSHKHSKMASMPVPRSRCWRIKSQTYALHSPPSPFIASLHNIY